MQPPFRIKICGVTTAADAAMVARAGADAVGLNFYPQSKRYVTPENAAAIVVALPAGIVTVGVFVNASLDEIAQTLKRAPVDAIQLHGDEPPEFLKQLAVRPIIRALRFGNDGGQAMDRFIDRCRELSYTPDSLLIDSYTAGEYGGTGATADWDAILQWKTQRAILPPLVLAGGLTPVNVAAAIRTVRPSAVDTASGVESSIGVKDERLVYEFVAQAQRAFKSR